MQPHKVSQAFIAPDLLSQREGSDWTSKVSGTEHAAAILSDAPRSPQSAPSNSPPTRPAPVPQPVDDCGASQDPALPAAVQATEAQGINVLT